MHLWYPAHFGQPYPALRTAAEAIERFACRTHCVGLRLEADGTLTLSAPYGLDDIFGFRLTPNTVLNNQATHLAKAARQTALWPELTVIPWPDDPAGQDSPAGAAVTAGEIVKNS